MDRTQQYREIILHLLNDYASVKSPFWPDVENQIVSDVGEDHYQLLRLGWDEHGNFVYAVAFHLALKDGKVLIYANNTDRNIAEELSAAGIAREDIVLAFLERRVAGQAA
jgi:hypothetical protein